MPASSHSSSGLEGSQPIYGLCLTGHQGLEIEEKRLRVHRLNNGEGIDTLQSTLQYTSIKCMKYIYIFVWSYGNLEVKHFEFVEDLFPCKLFHNWCIFDIDVFWCIMYNVHFDDECLTWHVSACPRVWPQGATQSCVLGRLESSPARAAQLRQPAPTHSS